VVNITASSLTENIMSQALEGIRVIEMIESFDLSEPNGQEERLLTHKAAVRLVTQAVAGAGLAAGGLVGVG
jgi:hypothetical protein